jgi:inhibitor of cysteine peptidase
LTADPAPLVFEKSQHLADSRNEGVAGSGGTQIFQFAADVSGSAKITLEYRRPWEKDAPPAKTFSVTINVVSK